MEKKICMALDNQIVYSNLQAHSICIEPGLKLCKSAQADMVALASVGMVNDTDMTRSYKTSLNNKHVYSKGCVSDSILLCKDKEH